MSVYSLIDSTGLILNIIEWDGVSEYTAPAGLTLEPNTPGTGPGWTKINSGWVAPPAEEDA